MAIAESELMRTCAPLYTSMAMESFATVIMGLCFSYLFLLITNKGRLKTPGQAVYRLVALKVGHANRAFSSLLMTWGDMQYTPLKERFGFCRRVNQSICTFQIIVALLTITRWLHVGMVNGFRYLGYAITCPPMQAELVLLISPVVPKFKALSVMSALITFVMLMSGYGASLIAGDMWTGDILDFLKGGSWEDLGVTTKFWAILPSFCCLVFLTFIKMPYLAILYLVNGGEKAGLPHDYLRLLGIVWVTWWCFPLWWCLSYEGASIIKDTKLNAVGFAVLNVVSKAAFTRQVIGMVKYTLAKEKEQQKANANGSTTNRSRGRGRGGWSVNTIDLTVNEAVAAKKSYTDSLFVEVLKPWDVDSDEEADEIVKAGKDKKEKKEEMQWCCLSEDFQAFLLGKGIYPSDFDKTLDANEQHQLKSQFNHIEEMVDEFMEASYFESEKVEMRQSKSLLSKMFEVDSSDDDAEKSAFGM